MQRLNQCLRRLLVTAVLSVFVAQAADAVVLDWDTATWTPGSLSQSYDLDPTNPGNDITLTIGGNTSFLRPDYNAPNAQTPALSTTLHGGLTPAQNTLLLATDFSVNTDALTITIAFSANYTQGVTNVSFSIFDLDSGAGFQDQLRSIRGVGVDGSTVTASYVGGPAVTTTGSFVVNGAGLSPDSGAGSNAGNLQISFSQPIRSMSFVFGNGASITDPVYQTIGIHDINFTPVPEVNPALAAAAGCVLVGWFRQRRRRSRASDRSTSS
ncbi:MAG: hypothetical protein AVDCRST_MAG42-209 [uncultured Chthoniobacterales bacterium]|uniref:PEP-CTERM protein-sorting domain-containing protein n=1 Tax=uncultured Chthoniobacterales bacterium TaxID=1836801 RepID=A0A6J4H3A0_9BACT|nr:MAG: hypothetical protein AVDCRST_MAG42-209 [uncultured Chthoniobacterales bacterium]